MKNSEVCETSEFRELVVYRRGLRFHIANLAWNDSASETSRSLFSEKRGINM